MYVSNQKQQFSSAYFQAVVAAAGYGLYRPEPDDDSVDWGIAAGSAETPRRPRVEVQLKCTARQLLTEDSVRFPLEIKNYNDLRLETIVPRILMVVLVPDDVESWLEQTEEQLALRHCGYWSSLAGQPETDNMTSVTVSLPRSQRFSPDGLRAMMQRVNDGEMP